MAKHNLIGKIGEDLAAKWLESKKFTIKQRNYLKKYGEIDIVARETNGSIHFIEVKSVSYETKSELESAVSHETWRPEENVHHKKRHRFGNVIETWLLEFDYHGLWQIDIITVRIVPREKYSQVYVLGNVMFE